MGLESPAYPIFYYIAMKNIDFPKLYFYICLFSLTIAGSFSFGLYSGAKKTSVYEILRDFKTTITNNFKTVSEEATTLTRIRPKHFLHPARHEGKGVTLNQTSNKNEQLVFLTGFFEDDNGLRLIRRDGEVVAKWTVRFSEIFTDTRNLRWKPTTDWNTDIHGALINPDGSVLFNFEGLGLVKLDRCGKIMWALPRETHHSIVAAEDGSYWVPSKHHYPEQTESPFPPFKTPFDGDTILKVSDEGSVLTEISVPGLFYENNLEALLTATGHWFYEDMIWDREIVHLNKIAELPSTIVADFPAFEAGALALSIREMNLVMVVDPKTHEIKWWRIGPWLRQHDPEFVKGGRIIVFNNNVYRNAYKIRKNKTNESSELPPSLSSNIIEIHPASDDYRVIYGNAEGQDMLSVIRGKVEATAEGGLLITEFEAGRVFQTDAEGQTVWEYINRYNDAEIAEITEAQVYPVSYFEVADWSCQ